MIHVYRIALKMSIIMQIILLTQIIKNVFSAVLILQIVQNV